MGIQQGEVMDIQVHQDIINEEFFEVKINFKDKRSMFSFIRSDDYNSISGSFKVLGMFREQHIQSYSEYMNIKDILD